jgi:hypothetical protein
MFVSIHRIFSMLARLRVAPRDLVRATRENRGFSRKGAVALHFSRAGVIIEGKLACRPRVS